MSAGLSIPSNPNVAVLSGKVSWFGGPHDPTDSGHTASGGSTAEPGIAIFNRATLGGYWRVAFPNGRQVVFKQTDLGPNPDTGRVVDVTYSALGHAGYQESNFPTDGHVTATYLGRNPQAALAAHASAQGASGGSLPTNLPVAPQQDVPGAIRDAMLSTSATSGISSKSVSSGGGLLSSVLTRLASGNYDTPAAQQSPISSYLGVSQKANNPVVASRGGVSTVDGKPVAGWIAPILAYARAHGWSGTVQSGYRSFAEQQAIYNSGVRPAARPGTSNHEQTQFPGGAVDVSNAAQLSAVLQHSPFAGKLVWAGAKDPVHFSHPHNGSY